MKKKYTKFLLTALLLLCSTVASAYDDFFEDDIHDFFVDGIHYYLPKAGTNVEVMSGPNYKGAVTIPSTVIFNGTIYDVTVIGQFAFDGCNELTSITIPSSITRMSAYAFEGCSSLTAVHISDLSAWCKINIDLYCTSPLYFANNLYLNGEKITNLVIPDDITEIKDQTFNGCSSFASVTIPNSVTSIGRHAFKNCTGLKSIVIPQNITSIGELAFENCENIESVEFYAENCVNMGSYYYPAFEGCSALTTVTIGDNVQSIPSVAFMDCVFLENVTIGKSVTSIGGYAFEDCYDSNVYISDLSAWCNIDFANSAANPLRNAKNLYLNGEKVTDLVIPDNITEIKNYAFTDCSSFASVTIPNSVTSIGDYAFWDCYNLTAVHISDLYAWCRIDFADKSSNPLDCAKNLYLNGEKVTNLVIPDDITEIKNYTFACCGSLTSVTIPNSVTSIGDDAFIYCENLTSVTIPNSVTTIGQNAFSGCYLLTSVTIPNSVTSIEDYAFYNCYSLKSITIGNSVASIGDYAFCLCGCLNDIYILAPTPPAVSNDISILYNANIYVPIGTKVAYQAADYWKYCNNIVEMDFTNIGEIKADYVSGEKEKIYYELNGRRIASPTKGIYIRNGKKIFIR